MKLLPHCNDNTRPLILLGSCTNLTKIKDVCDHHSIEIAGIMDHDYFGNTSNLSGIDVIDSEENLSDITKFKYYQKNYNFFCATTWMPEKNPASIRNREKRQRLLDTINAKKLSTISLIDSSARISSDSVIGRNVFIDAFVLIETAATIADHSNIYAYSAIGHHATVMKNCVIQRRCSIAGDCVLEDDTYIGTYVKILKPGARFGSGTFINECIYIRRGTVPGEIVSRNSENQKRVYLEDNHLE